MNKELKMGLKVEMEHKKSVGERLVRKIALDHLKEDPNYYTKLKKAGL